MQKMKLALTLAALVLLAVVLWPAPVVAGSDHTLPPPTSSSGFQCEIFCWSSGTSLCFQGSDCHVYCCDATDTECSVPCW